MMLNIMRYIQIPVWETVPHHMKTKLADSIYSSFYY